ncbi:MAG: hypothetical protein LBJ95_02205 [Oscillospiraceae bacterium]|nr:hypothetical protein [Oscillospiraceae bacterium]
MCCKPNNRSAVERPYSSVDLGGRCCYYLPGSSPTCSCSISVWTGTTGTSKQSLINQARTLVSYCVHLSFVVSPRLAELS